MNPHLLQACDSRCGTDSALICNAEMTPTEVRKHCQALLDELAQPLLKLAMTQQSLSPHVFHRMLKLARTIADMASAERVASPQ